MKSSLDELFVRAINATKRKSHSVYGMTANEMIIVARLADHYEKLALDRDPLEVASEDFSRFKKEAPRLWLSLKNSKLSDRKIGDWLYDFFKRYSQSGQSLKNFALDEGEPFVHGMQKPTKLEAVSKSRWRATASERRLYGGSTVTEFWVFVKGDPHAGGANSVVVKGYGKTPGERKTDALRKGEILLREKGII